MLHSSLKRLNTEYQDENNDQSNDVSLYTSQKPSNQNNYHPIDFKETVSHKAEEILKNKNSKLNFKSEQNNKTRSNFAKTL